MDNSDELFKESSLYDLPSDIYFSPYYLSDEGDLFGTAYEYDNSKINYLMKYNVNLSEKKKIEGTEYTVGYEAVKALAVSNQHLIYEKYSNGTLNYILYDMNTDESKTIIQLNSVPTMYTSQVTIHDDLALFSLFNAETGLYQLKSYSFSTNEVKEIENSNSAFPIYYKGLWFYIRIDNENLITELIAYDLNLEEKEVIFSTEGVKLYINSIATDEDVFIITTGSPTITTCYEVDFENEKICPLFSAEYMG